FQPGGIDVASWMDEEATFAHFVGARSFCGLLPEAEIGSAANADGLTLAAALEQAGYAGRPLVSHEPRRQIAYLEAHIEQGGRLESAAKRIGVVTAIVGIREFRVTFSGQQNHAGTTPMAIRRDATLALIQFAQQLHQAFQGAAAADTVWNFGRIDVNPGAVGIVAREAQLTLQMRDGDTGVLDRLEAVLYDLADKANAAGPVAVRAESMLEPAAPAAMDVKLQAHLGDAAARYAPDSWMPMPSGAGHDAQVLAGVLPSGMLFVPSIKGISHSFDEDTALADIVLGCQVLADAAASILHAAESAGSRPLSAAT
ncbi:MAG: M20/M25/M40 family metallo-hydrolase, partial [Gammaproteobacteria bacterium]|nr:M20/M25/M40 family metallo-hydrolase [Gammaproteobacteria bacterium]